MPVWPVSKVQTLRQGVVAPVPRGEHGPRVVAARHHQARPFSVEVRNRGEEAVDAVAVGVPPVADGAARHDVRSGGERVAVQAVEDGEKLGARQDVAGGVAPVGGRVADHIASTIDRSIGGPAGDLRPAVAVQIVDDELRVMCAGADVRSEVDAPQACPGQRVGVEIDRAGVAALRVVFRVRRIPFDDELVLAVAIQVAGARVVRAVGVGFAGRRRTAGRNLERHAQVRLHGGCRRHREARARRLLEAEQDRPDVVGVGLRQVGGAVHVVGRAVNG